MKIDILLPQLGESITEATIVRWLKNIGDTVAQNEPLLEISTEKVDTEIRSPAGGTLCEIACEPGSTVRLPGKAGMIDTTLAAAPQPPAQPASREKKQKAAKILPPQVASLSAQEDEEEESRFFSPLVRTIAHKYGVSDQELARAHASGAGGRITKEDVLAIVAAREHKPAATEPQEAIGLQPSNSRTILDRVQPSRQEKAKPLPGIEWESDGTCSIAMDTVRQAIAEHMSRSKQTSPHVYSIQEVDLHSVMKWRQQHRESFERQEGFSLSVTPFFLEAVVRALIRFPFVNSTLRGKSIILKKNVHLGCAVAVGDPQRGLGLLVPVIRNAEDKSLVDLARALNDLANRARTKKLLPEEVTGGTFTVTNPGALGTLIGTPIINQPQAAILCIGAMTRRPVAIGDMLAIREMCYLTLSYDHRIIDGALSAAFLREIKHYLEGWDLNRPLP